MNKALVLLAATLIAGTAFADGHLPKVEAEVRRVDPAAGKISLRHGYVPNLDMPPMTMVFQLDPSTALDEIKAGDRVLVTIEQIDGAYTVKSIEIAQ